MQTVGISPKLAAATAAAVLSYLITQTLVDFPAWVDLIINAVSVAVAAWTAGPGQLVAPEHEERDLHEVT